MAIYKFNHGKFFGPSATFTGYAMLACGIVVNYPLIRPASLFLIIPGLFISFTFTGTVLDTEKKIIKNYTSLFGVFKRGKWVDLNLFTKFIIKEVTDKYSTTSRGSVTFSMGVTNILLILTNQDETKAILVGKFRKPEAAEKAQEELSLLLFKKTV